MVQSLSATDAQALVGTAPGVLVLDVREAWEVQLAPLNLRFVHLPMHLVTSRFEELDRAAPILCICHHGVRSMQVAHFLVRQGFDAVFNLGGGTDAWSREVDPSVVRY